MRFEYPEFFLLGLLILPLMFLGWRSLALTDRVRRNVILTLRTLLLFALITVLAGPQMVQRHDRLTVIGLLDVSGSIKRFADLPSIRDQDVRSNLEYLRWWFRQAAGTQAPDDRFGLIVFDGRAVAISSPTAGDYVDDNIDISLQEGTNIAEAIRLGLAMFPPDTNRRLVLVSDGNETMGNALEVARQLAATPVGGATVPIDVVPVDYEVTSDAQVVRIEAPQTAQPGQTVALRIVMESTVEMPGRITLLHEGSPVDINPGRSGFARPVTLPRGISVHRVELPLSDMPVNRFEAIFEPDDPAMDTVPENNRGMAFTSTPSRGQILIVDRQDEGRTLEMALQEQELRVQRVSPGGMPDEPLSLQGYDLVAMVNVPAYELSRRQQLLLRQYVEEFGGGLLMVGGPQSLGAGGWNHTELSAIMPVLLDPTKELRRPTSALVLVIDNSGSMNRPVAGARATQQEVANEAAAMAIESLHTDTWVGLVVFNHTPSLRVPIRLNENPKEVADEIRSIMAGGGTRIEPALRMGYEQLRKVDVQNRHIVLLTDGQSHDPTIREFVHGLASDGVILTTIGIGDEAYIDRELLQWMADETGGTFYHARDPRILPRVMADSVQVLNRPLIKEDVFRPEILPTGSPLTLGMDSAPTLDGLVITAPRDDPSAVIEMRHPDGEPLLAHWQAGLGRVAVFASDAGGTWATRWLNWGGYVPFWTQLVRTMTRPVMSTDAEMSVDLRDGELRVAMEMYDESADSFTQVGASVYMPDGRVHRMQLREVSPGRYEAAVPAPGSGNYIVAMTPRRDGRPLAPLIGGVSQLTGEEFRRYQSNADFLREIAETTGGRELDLMRPEAMALFDRTGMPPTRSTMPAWRSLAWIVLILLLMDVASRRIAWTAETVRLAVTRSLNWIAIRDKRARAAAATLGSLRQVRADRAEKVEAARIRSENSARGSAGANAEATPTSSSIDHSVARQSQFSTPRPASNVAPGAAAGERDTTVKPRPSVAQDQPPGGSSGEPRSDTDKSDGSTTRELLAAKRRARQRLSGDDD